jgi:hypothetical protein
MSFYDKDNHPNHSPVKLNRGSNLRRKSDSNTPSRLFFTFFVIDSLGQRIQKRSSGLMKRVMEMRKMVLLIAIEI